MSEELLDLNLIVDHPTINIVSKLHPKGKQYELVNLADLGPFDYAIIWQRNAEVEKLRNKKKLTPAEERTVERMVDETVKLLCPTLEPSVLKQMPSSAKQMVIFVWQAKLTQTTGAAEGNARKPRTTAASSRASKSSTAATRGRGSKRQPGS